MKLFCGAALLAAALFVGTAQANEDTEASPDFYRAMLHRVFAEAHGADVLASATIIPNSRPEQVVALRQKGSRYAILTFEPEIHLWNFAMLAMMEQGDIRHIDAGGDEALQREIRELRAELPKDAADVRQTRCERKIAKGTAIAIAARFEEIWAAPPLGDLDEIVLHGTSYEFFVRHDGDERRTDFYAPNDARPEGRLAALSHAMLRYCAGRMSAVRLDALAQPHRD